MGKLQPNFSWQKYEGKDADIIKENSTEQFQFQLQSEHIQVANTTNGTIDDLSYFATPRSTSWAWVDTSQIYKLTLATSDWTSTGTINTISLSPYIQGDFTVIYMQCCISNGTTAGSITLNIPHIDVTTSANQISIIRNGTNIVLTSGGTNRSSYSGYVTIYYVLTGE